MARKNTTLVAEICLYGNSRADVGAGWLARTADGRMFGDGDPKPGRGFTAAVWQAQEAIRATGVKGIIRVFAPGGLRMANLGVNDTAYFGDLKWEAATMIEISVEAIEAAAVAG